MTKITIEVECNNCPKKSFLRDLNIAFATGDADFIISNVSDGINWAIYGDKEIYGKKEFVREVNIMKDYVADEMTLHSIVTQGSSAALNGEMKMGGRLYVFCDMYEFISAKSNTICQMRSYVIQI